MTWKSYAAVSGATVLAGWLASTPPSNTPSGSAPASGPAASRRAAAAPDIQQQATRLQARVRREIAYSEPGRNPFRFGAARTAPSSRVDRPESVEPAETVVTPAVPAPLPVSLSGIAEDQIEQRIERTAILSSPGGVLLVHEGDDVLDQYRVARIDSESVELVKLADGSTLRLSLKN